MSIHRRSFAIAPVATVFLVMGKKWPDWPWRDRDRIIRDSMYSELLGAFKALRVEFQEYRENHPR